MESSDTSRHRSSLLAAGVLSAAFLLGGCEGNPAGPSEPQPPAPGNPDAAFSVVGQGSQTARFTSDLWIHGDVAYTGTWGVRDRGNQPLWGNRLYVWDVADPEAPSLVDSVSVDAVVVNDVKVSADGTLGVLTHEGSDDRLNGITLLDLADPRHPEVIGRFTETLENGVHNVWIEGGYVYAVVNGVSPDAGLRILDVSDPAAPRVAASFYAGSSFLHDVSVRDGLAFLSHWDAGLVILDVGHGVAGGSPENPVEVGRVRTMGGQTHNAWYWPERGYVFVGEEDFGFAGSGRPGTMHVVDVRELSDPIEVASFRVEGSTPHNFWLDEQRGVLYAAWYGAGLVAIDVTGELEGALETQDRRLGSLTYAGPGGRPCQGATTTSSCTWAPQLHGGLVFVSDMNTGLWALRPDF